MAIKRYVGLGKEAFWGTAVAATRFIRTKENIVPDMGYYIPKPIIQRGYTQIQQTKYLVQGSIGEFDVRPDNIGELLYGVLGVCGTVVEGSYYKHTIGGSDTLPFYTVRAGVETKERIIPSMLVQKLTFRFGANIGPLKAIVNMLGRGPETDGNLDVLQENDFSEESMFTMENLTFKVDVTDRSAYLFDGEINIENTILIDKMRHGGDYLLGAPRYGERNVSGNLSLAFDDLNERNIFLNKTDFQLSFEWVRGNQYLKVYCPICRFLKDVSGHVAPIDEAVVLNAPFKAFLNWTNGYDLYAILKNKVSSY